MDAQTIVYLREMNVDLALVVYLKRSLETTILIPVYTNPNEIHMLFLHSFVLSLYSYLVPLFFIPSFHGPLRVFSVCNVIKIEVPY